MAKAPVRGRVKTRLCPPCTSGEAAALAEAMLADTLAAVAATPSAWARLVLDGDPGPWLPDGIGVVPQRGRGLDERLEAAFADAGAPALVIAGDTPQVTPALLRMALAALDGPGADAVLGPAPDGGYWALGLRRPVAGVFAGVPMSRPTTLRDQRSRLRALGLSVTELPPLRDVDTMADAREVAAECVPGSRFPAVLARVERAVARRASRASRVGRA
ncbi:DUF2064 domain-containing protein [Actinomadura vinacea]|uniref:DUF2064 domain-containing protein n=1 Tax=Actinomadura vinacea TaxID=115336 RepID=A0ABP5X9B6_9ACTN